MKRTTITIPDDLESRIDEYLQTPDAPPSLSAVVRAALEAYLERQEIHEPRWSPTATSSDRVKDLRVPGGALDRETDRADDTADGLPRFLMLEDLTQEELDQLDRSLNITPAKQGSGLTDVSVNHDKYLAEDK